MTETFTPIGPDYCVRHHGIREEDQNWCDFRDEDDCTTCEGTGMVSIRETDGTGGQMVKDCPNCEDGGTLCDLRPLGYTEDAADLTAEIDALRSVVREAHDAFVLTFHGVVWNRLTPDQIEAVDRALNPAASGLNHAPPDPVDSGSGGES